MKTFNVYHHEVNGYEAIKVGFAWPALFLGALWMLVFSLWWQAAAWIFALVMISKLQTSLGNASHQAVIAILLFVFWLFIVVYPASVGNKWREQNLKRRGYDFIKSIQEKSVDAAIAKVAKDKKKTQ